jgi:cell pole-organizing protein PopZ
MTQAAKAQEPSMEEILASIRRIIADDEVKSPESAAEAAKPAPVAAKPEAAPRQPMTGIPPSKLKPSVAVEPTPQPEPPKAAAAAGNSQDDIDAMLAGLDAETTAEEVRPPRLDGDVLELTEQMAMPLQTPPAFHKVEPSADLEFSEPEHIRAPQRAPEPPVVQPRSAARPLPDAPAIQQTIMSQTTTAAVESAFNALAGTVLSNNARTLEDLVKEMLRPMLKAWLDDNLPGLVERIVRAEIERVSRGR